MPRCRTGYKPTAHERWRQIHGRLGSQGEMAGQAVCGRAHMLRVAQFIDAWAPGPWSREMRQVSYLARQDLTISATSRKIAGRSAGFEPRSSSHRHASRIKPATAKTSTA